MNAATAGCASFDAMFDDSERLQVFDPLAPPSEIDKLVAERETAIVLLELSVELGLPTHGGPTDRAALERALLTPEPGAPRSAASTRLGRRFRSPTFRREQVPGRAA